jgi:hypothetical protein
MARYRHEQPKPVGTIIGVVVCLGAIGGFLILVSTGVIKLGGKKQQPERLPSSGPVIPPPNTGNTGNGGTTTGTRPVRPVRPVTAPGEVIVSFSGSFSETGDTRKVTYKCPHAGCGKEIVDVLIPKCTGCGKSIKWPQKVPCRFCTGGKCKSCEGKGKCSRCGQGRRMLMGVKPPCDVCNNTEKCQACTGTGTCTFCEGGTFYPGKPKTPPKSKSDEPPPIPKPKPE